MIVRYPANGLNASPSYVDTAALDTFAVATGTLVGADVDAGTTLTYGINGGSAENGVVSKVSAYGTLAVTAATGAYTFTPNSAAINALSVATTEIFTVSVSDGIATTTTNLVINLAGVNDAPVNTVPGAQTVAEDTALAFSGVAAISVADVDGNLASTRLTVTNGTLAVTLGTTGATISAGANNSATLTLAGTAAQMNAALATLVYQGKTDFNGADMLTVVATDALGATDTDTVAITVTSVNDAPVNTVPGAQTVAEDTALAFSGAAAISVADVDGNLTNVRLTVTNGTLAVTLGTTGATISAGANNSATFTLAGTQTQINAALVTLVYQGTLNFNGSDTLTVVSTDSANPALADTDTVAITVTAVNDAPVLAAGKVTLARSASFTVNTNGEVALTETGLVPAGAKVVGVTLNLEYSTYWSSAAVSGCYVRLNGVTFGPLGWTGLGTSNNFVAVERKYAGPLSGYNAGAANTWTFGSAWNPTNLRNVALTVYYELAGEPALVLTGTEDTTVSFTAAMFENAFKDVENTALAGVTVVTLPATGTLKLGTTAVTPGQVIAAANLGNLTYEPAANDNGAKTFTVTASDGALSSAAATVTINLAPVNDAPVATASSGNTVATVQTPVVVDPGITVTDIDSATLASATVTISSGFQSDQDALGFLNAGAQIHGNISAGFNALTGVLTLSSAQASATLEQWQAALRAVTFSNSSSTPNVANRTILYVVNDGGLPSAAASKIFVPDYNLPPAFITAPAPVAAIQGTSVFLSAVVSGWPTPALQWRRNGVPIEGATRNILAIHGVIPSDAGSYDLVASNVVQIVASGAVDLTVTAQPGELFGTGLSEYGSLGDLSAQGGVTRQAKQLWSAAGAEGVVQVAAAGRHSLILTVSGKAYGMGHNLVSALGIASNAASYPTPELILDNVRQVAAAQDNSYFLRRDGTLWGVGTTQQGMLGEYYPGAGSTVPFPLVPGQTNIVGVWAGGTAGNGGCIYLTRDGQLFLLGGPTVYAPVRLDTDVVDAAQGAGFRLWVKTDGSLWAQGSNTFGQLGTGGTTDLAVPQKVSMSADVARVFAGPSFALFIKRNGSLWAMGRNTFGQLGIGSAATFQSTPALVMDSVSSVACGERHAILLKSDGSVWTMGNNYYGQLGDGTAEERRAPVPIASNAVAVAAGAYYSLHVAPVAPTITTQPEGKALVAGGGATLSVGAAGTPVLLYQWKKDGIDVSAGTAASLSLAAVTSNQAGSYVVVVSNGRGSVTSAAAVVTVDQTPTAPSIVSHPVGVAVKTGASATFTVRAAGTGTLVYQWRRNEVALAGATSATLTLPSVQFAQAGLYDVVVTNTVGSATSAPAPLSLLDILPPVITRDPVAVATTPGQRVEFSVDATGTDLRYLWSKDSVDIPGASGRVFALAAAGVPDAGAYSVAVFNDLGRVVSNSAQLRVDSVQGTMKVMGSAGLLAAGGAITLELGTSYIGTAPVQLGWTLVLPPGFSYAGGESEPEVKPSVGNTGSVDWAYVSIPANSATFRVRISYVAGLTGKHTLYGTVSYRTGGLPTSVSPAPVTVLRVDSPVITRQPAAVFVVAGTPASLSVDAQGGELSYQWYRNGLTVPGATSSTLAFDPARIADAGDYMVRVGNSVATVESSVAKLTVFEVVAEHAVQGPGYVEGQNIEITNTITYAGGDALMGWQVLLPKGWTFVGSSGDAGDIRRNSSADLLEWEWTSFPVSPVRFSYTLKVPESATGRNEIAALLTFVRGGKSGLVLAKPDPLKLERVNWHSADLDHSFTFSLFELLRVIELYNTRRGTVRTGAYLIAQGTEDGFTPDFDRASGVPLTLPSYHSADYGRDGSINLLELLRMIELYNFSANRSRTGQFHRSAGTEDGFAPGPAPAASGGAGVN